MELSYIFGKFLYFPNRKLSLYFLKRKFCLYFLIFQETDTSKKKFIYQEEIEALKSFLCFRKCNFLRLNPKIQKINPEKKSLYFRKWNFLGLILKRFLYFRKWNPALSGLGPENVSLKDLVWKSFLYFLKKASNFQDMETPKKTPYISRNGTF